MLTAAVPGPCRIPTERLPIRSASDTLWSTIVAPGMPAPAASCTIPQMLPKVDCPKARAGMTIAKEILITCFPEPTFSWVAGNGVLIGPDAEIEVFPNKQS